MGRITVGEAGIDREAEGAEYLGLEAGDILYFPTSPLMLTADDRDFLLGRRQANGLHRKNISYRPAEDRLKGVAATDASESSRVHEILREFSARAVGFASRFLRAYASAWSVDYASFRPIEEQGRRARLHARNDLLHVDAFPNRPSHGDRILRYFINIHPERERVWQTSESFPAVADRFAPRVGVTTSPGAVQAVGRAVARWGARLGLPVVERPPYDAYMLRIHNAMKEDADFQRNCPKERWSFPAGSAWMVFTDGASHACLSGRYMLEQTFLIARDSLTRPELAPISVLEGLAGRPLARAAR